MTYFNVRITTKEQGATKEKPIIMFYDAMYAGTGKFDQAGQFTGGAYFSGLIPLWSMSGADLSRAYIDRNPNIPGWKYENGQLWRI